MKPLCSLTSINRPTAFIPHLSFPHPSSATSIPSIHFQPRSLCADPHLGSTPSPHPPTTPIVRHIPCPQSPSMTDDYVLPPDAELILCLMCHGFRAGEISPLNFGVRLKYEGWKTTTTTPTRAALAADLLQGLNNPSAALNAKPRSPDSARSSLSR